MNFYKHYLGDYARDTQDLTLVEHGAYRVLLDHFYATKGDLPDDVQALFRIAKAFTPSERKAVEKVAGKFFPVNGDGRRHNKRAEIEIRKHLGQAETNRLIAEERERKRREQKSLLDGAHDQSTIRAPSHSQKPEESKASEATPQKAAATPLPDCPQEKLVALYHELLPTCTRMVEWNANRQALMRARWREKAVAKGPHKGYATEAEGLAFWRRFFAYVEKSDFLTGRSTPTDGRKPFVASLEWLLKPANFAKVIEGNYHS